MEAHNSRRGCDADIEDLLAQMSGQLIALTSICALLVATHPDPNEVMPIIRNLGTQGRPHTGRDKQLFAGIADVIARVETLWCARMQAQGVHALQ